MKTEYVLYGILPNEKFETLLIVRDSEQALAPYIERAKKEGMTGIRIARHDYNDLPDFVGAINL